MAISELPASHHQRKKRIRRFLFSDNFAPISAQCALIPAICRMAGIKGLAPVMIDWSDLGRKRNGLFAAVCFRRRGLPLLSWVTTPDDRYIWPPARPASFRRRPLRPQHAVSGGLAFIRLRPELPLAFGKLGRVVKLRKWW